MIRPIPCPVRSRQTGQALSRRSHGYNPAAMAPATAMRPLEIGGGRVERSSGGDRLILPPVPQGYGDAQVDDYHHLSRKGFLWRPPLRMRVRARASHEGPLGTLGFGFWNDPFTLSLGQVCAARRLPAPPRALWFFYASPPGHLSFTSDAPGHGWKAMALDTPAVPSWLLAPAAAVALLLTRLPRLRPAVMRRALGSVRAAEAILAVSLTEWHDYRLEWAPAVGRFWVDDRLVLEALHPPPGPLGFVAWIDNQYAVASPAHRLRFGALPTSEEQWLEIAALDIERL